MCGRVGAAAREAKMVEFVRSALILFVGFGVTAAGIMVIFY